MAAVGKPSTKEKKEILFFSFRILQDAHATQFGAKKPKGITSCRSRTPRKKQKNLIEPQMEPAQRQTPQQTEWGQSEGGEGREIWICLRTRTALQSKGTIRPRFQQGRPASLPAELEPSRRPRGRISAPEDGETPEDPAETHLPAAACPGAVRRGRGERETRGGR